MTREHTSDVWFERPVEGLPPRRLRVRRVRREGSVPQRRPTCSTSGSTRARRTRDPGDAPRAQARVGPTRARRQRPSSSTSKGPTSTAAGSTRRSWSASAPNATRRSRRCARTAGCSTRRATRCTSRSATSSPRSRSSRSTARTSCAGGRCPPTGAVTCASATRSCSASRTRTVRNTFRFLLGNLGLRSEKGGAAREAVGGGPRVPRSPRRAAREDPLGLERAAVPQGARRRARRLHRGPVGDLPRREQGPAHADARSRRARRSAQTGAVARAARADVCAASPALVYTATRRGSTTTGCSPSARACTAEWAATADGSSDEWMFLREVRDVVNAAIEPLRAAKTLATTAEAEIVLTAPAAWIGRLRAVRRRARVVPHRGEGDARRGRGRAPSRRSR